MASPSSHAPRRSGASPSSSAAAPGSEQVIGKFKRLHHIGKGSFAEVYRGIHIVRCHRYCLLLWPGLDMGIRC